MIYVTGDMHGDIRRFDAPPDPQIKKGGIRSSSAAISASSGTATKPSKKSCKN